MFVRQHLNPSIFSDVQLLSLQAEVQLRSLLVNETH